MRRALCLATILGLGAPAAADDRCHDELAARGVSWKPARRSGVADAVEIRGPLGGVAWTPPGREPLVIDCSLAVSLAEAGRMFRAVGITEARWVSATRYATSAAPITARSTRSACGRSAAAGRPDVGALAVAADFEPGLGDAVDCVGQPMTQGGAVLKVLQCQLVRSGLFYLVLSPDYDDAHHDHFHLEARPWSQRPQVTDARQAIH
jgi:hypothetical protein